jgi:hypothetical protein
LLATALVSCAPQAGEARGPGADRREIPIELRGGVVIVPVKVGKSRVLRIVLDTGMGFDGVLLYEALPNSTFPGPLTEVRVPGAGAGEPARGLMTESGSFSAGPVQFHGQRVVWLTDTLMHGFPSEGVMGYSLFGHWIVEIDYDRKVLVLHEPGAFRPDSTWTVLPMVLPRHGSSSGQASLARGPRNSTAISTCPTTSRWCSLYGMMRSSRCRTGWSRRTWAAACRVMTTAA